MSSKGLTIIMASSIAKYLNKLFAFFIVRLFNLGVEIVFLGIHLD